MKYTLSLALITFLTASQTAFAGKIDSNHDGKLVEAEIEMYVDSRLQEIKEKLNSQGESSKYFDTETSGTGIDTYD